MFIIASYEDACAITPVVAFWTRSMEACLAEGPTLQVSMMGSCRSTLTLAGFLTQ